MFYSNYSDDCIYTEELFSKISLKYKTKVLNFAKIDVDLNENLCSKYKIYLTRMCSHNFLKLDKLIIKNY